MKKLVKILLVEDSPTITLCTINILKRLNNILEDIELIVYSASSGYSGIDMCKREYFDIVLMDVVLPDISGIMATKQIKAKNKNQIIYGFTSKIREDDVELFKHGLNNGLSGYISKPINSDEIKQVILNLYRHKIIGKDKNKVIQTLIYLLTTFCGLFTCGFK